MFKHKNIDEKINSNHSVRMSVGCKIFLRISLYEGVSINNQPIPFPMERERVTIFMLCFNICFIHGYKIAHV